MRIIVDGYNVINKLPDLKRLLNDLEKAREGLNRICSAYGKAKKIPVTVVYDGVGGSWGQRQKIAGPGIKEIFTAAGEKADPVIIRMARDKPKDTVVVTADNEIISACVKAGASAVSPFEFEEAAIRAMYESDDGFGKIDDEDDGRRDNKKGPSKRPGKSEKRKIKVLKKL